MRKKEEQLKNKDEPSKNTFEFVLRLFITGATPNSIRAVTNIKQICDEHLKGRYSLAIIDVYQQPSIAAEEQLVALPLLIRKQPLPERRLIGDLSNTEKVLQGLGLLSYAEQPGKK
jgi:circadian clock protein KaiB